MRHAKTPNYKTSNQVRIANNFYGYIKGIKYYKDDAGISDNIDYFTDSSDSNSNILLYFRFEDQFFDEKEKKFKNLASYNNWKFGDVAFNDTVFEINT